MDEEQTSWDANIGDLEGLLGKRASADQAGLVMLADMNRLELNIYKMPNWAKPECQPSLSGNLRGGPREWWKQYLSAVHTQEKGPSRGVRGSLTISRLRTKSEQ